MVNFIDKTSDYSGTPLNRSTMMAIQGFERREIIFNEDGTIKEEYADGSYKIISFSEDTIRETYYAKNAEGEYVVSMRKIIGLTENNKIMEIIR